jgi:3-hydroxymyristoyl/3-hydroxydecanoyl-(acyl carrier protein) dehydratase
VKCAHTLIVAVDHPAFAGHFPGMPVLPGAVLLDEVLHILEEELALDPIDWQITAAKFLEPVHPGDVLTVEHTSTADAIRFAVTLADRPALSDRPALAGTLSRLLPEAAHDV